MDGEKTKEILASESFDDVRSFITNQMGSLIRLNGSEGSLMFKTKIENLSSDVRQKKREFQRHPASMTQSPDISGHSEKSCNSSLLIERIKLILREAF